jgi:hypothetical protein
MADASSGVRTAIVAPRRAPSHTYSAGNTTMVPSGNVFLRC